MKCVGCGASIYDDVNRCQYCGAYQSVNANSQRAQAVAATAQPVIIHNVIHNTSPQQDTGYVHERVSISGKSKLVALVLCFFFGGIGAHKFYVGKVGAGIFYLLTVGIFGIGWVLDFIFILCGSFTDKWGRPLKR